MADNEIRNPSKAYFKWKMPVIAKSEDDWNFWNTEDKYNRTMFIGYNDTTTPHVASLFIIVDGKAMQAVGDDVLARIAKMEVDISTQMAEIQQLITQANEQQQSINTLRTEVQLVLQNCSAFADEAEIWAEGSDEDVAAYGGEHSAKGWALRAGEIISTGLPSEASFDKLTVTGAIPSNDMSTRVPNTEWVQNAIQAGGGGVSPDSDITCKSITTTSGGASLTASYSAERSDTTSIKVTPATQGTAGSIVLDARTSNWEYPAQISITNTLMQAKVPGRMEITVGDTDSSSVDLSISTQPYVSTPWTHQLNCMLPIRANNGLYVKNRSTNESAFIATNTLDDDAATNPKLTVSGTLSVYGERTNTSGSKSSVTMLAHRAASDTDGSYVMLKAENSGSGSQSYLDVQEGETQIGTPKLTYFDKGDKTSSTEAIRIGKASEQAYSTKRYIYSELIGRFVNGLQIGLINDYEPDGVPFKVLRSNTTTSGNWLAAFGVTPTVPDITDTADSSDKVPNTKWVQAAIAAGGGGGGSGAVSSVNGQTGAVVLSGQDIKTDPNATNTIYQDWAELSSQLSGKQSAIGQDSSLSLNSITLANSSTGTVGTLKLASQDGAIEFRPNGTYLGGIIGRSGEGMLITGNDLHIGYQFSSPTGILVSRTDSKTTHNFATEFTNTVSCSADIAASDNSQQLATTQWVNAAIAAAGGGGSGAVTSVNGKTGEVVLSASDVGAASTSDLADYVTTDAMNTELTNFATTASVDTKLADYQPKLIAGDGIAISESNVISVTGGIGGAVSSVNGKTGEVVLNATDVGAITGAEADTKITTALEPYAKTADVTTTLEPYAKSADVTAEINAAVEPLATTEALNTGLAGKQDKLTAGEGITISAENVISATGGSGGGAVTSVNGNTGAVVLTGDNIMTASDSTTSLNSALAGKQANITAETDLTVGSLTAGSADSGLYAGRYSIRFTSNGNDKLFVDATGPYVSNLTGGDLGPATGAFNWYINTTTDYNKFNVFNRYHVTNEETHEVTTNDTSVLSIGGSPTDHSTWIDFTATYMSFKGNTNFGEAGMNHAMTFNGPSTFTGTATVHKLIAGDGYEGTMFTCNANAWLNYDTRIGWDSGRLRCARTDDDFMFDFNHSASAGQRIRFNDTVTILSAMPAAADSSTTVPTTAWVQSAIAASSGGSGEIGDIGFAPLGIDESENKRRYLNGQVIIQSQFVAFTNKVKAAIALFPSLSTTEENWQAEKTNSKLGQCGKFVIDDTAGTIRLPCVVNAQGLVDLALIGGIKSESLPNITGSLYNNQNTYQDIGIDTATTSGAISVVTDSNQRLVNSNDPEYRNNILGWNFDASRSSSTYQDNAPVQQEAVQYPYYIQVATGVEETLPAIREYNINTPFFFGKSMYSDVAPDNASWLASNGQWNAKTVYPDYYDWLLEQMNAGVSGFVASTDTYTDYDFVINTTDQTFRLPLLDGSEDLPSDRKTSLSIRATGSQETAPANGFYCLRASNNTNSLEIYVGTSTNFTLHATTRDDAGYNGVFVPVKSGDTITYYYAGTGTPDVFQFIYAQGNGSLYYYVGDTVQDASLINAGAVLGQLSNKADIDASNFNAAGKSLLSGLGMPSSRYIDLTLGASGSTYTAPANGWFVLDKEATAVNQFAALYNTGKGPNVSTIKSIAQTVIPGASNLGFTIPALKGDIIHLDYNLAGNTIAWRFVYAEGDQ